MKSWQWSIVATMFLAAVVFSSIGQGASRASAADTFGKPDLKHGATVYAASCAACHGAKGEGGPMNSPALTGENKKKSLAKVEQFIATAAPPMPKLYPGQLSAQDVADVSGFIEKL